MCTCLNLGFYIPESVEVSGKKMQARALAMDFSKVDDAAQWAAFQGALEGLDIGVLGAFGDSDCTFLCLLSTVNNVGRSLSFPADFVDASVDEVDGILAINVSSLLKVTRVVLPGMIQRYVSCLPTSEPASTDRLQQPPRPDPLERLLRWHHRRLPYARALRRIQEFPGVLQRCARRRGQG